MEFIIHVESTGVVMENVLDCDIVKSKVEFQSRYFKVILLGKYEFPYLTSYGLKNTTAIFLQEWFWYAITHQC